MTLRSVAVFCGSSPGRLPVYREQAEATGRLLAERGIDVVYGGGRAGLMGVVADSALAAGGRVVGVIPRALHERELTHTGVTELHVVETMHERKAIMADRSDAFVALPGGAGTLEEIAEQWTWAQLGIHAKPCGFLDVDGFWDPVRVLLERMVGDGFVREHQRGIVTFDHDLARLLDTLAETPEWAGSDKVAPEDVPQP